MTKALHMHDENRIMKPAKIVLKWRKEE
jgi:hypothetical protein